MIEVGLVFNSLNYGKAKVLRYSNSSNVLIEFESTGFRVWTTSEQVMSGSIKDKLAKTVCGVGYIGSGSYKPSSLNRKPYMVWRSMLQRCYMATERQKSYKGCTVCEEWHNFQVFAKWFEFNYIDGFELDKDILVKGNKVYSPETCLFVSKLDNLAENSKRVTLMNGITGEIFSFKSIQDASKFTRKPMATLSRLAKERKGKCTSDGWFAI